MKLFFKVNEDGDITAEMQNGTMTQPFSYILMLKQLIPNNTIEEPGFVGLNEAQHGKIIEILNKIHDKVEEGLNMKSNDLTIQM